MVKFMSCFYYLVILIISSNCIYASNIISINHSNRDPFTFKADSSYQNDNTQLKLTSVTLHYAKASSLTKLLNQRSFHILSKLGSIQFDSRTSQLWIHDDLAHTRIILKIIKKLDIAVPQILIKTKILNVDENYVKQLGFGFNQSQTSSSSTIKNNTSKLDILPQIPIVKLSNNIFLNLQVKALTKTGHAKMISQPELFTMDHKAATIESGEEIPYQQTSLSGGTSVAFKKAVLALKVTPDILPNHKVLLHINVSQDTLSSFIVNGVPAIKTQHLTTDVLLSDRATVILGGITNNTMTSLKMGVPILKDIPLLGILFRSHQSYIKKSELLLLVTPIIIKQKN